MATRQQLLQKVGRGEILSPDEDYALCTSPIQKVSVGTFSKRNEKPMSILSKSQVREFLAQIDRDSETRRAVKAEVTKAMNVKAERPAVSAARELGELLRARKLQKAAGTAKREITVPELAAEIAARSPDLAFTAGCALAKQALRSPVNMNPFASSYSPSIPGGSRSLGDVGGKFETTGGRDPWSEENMARVGSADALARLVQTAMKPAVLATRY